MLIIIAIQSIIDYLISLFQYFKFDENHFINFQIHHYFNFIIFHFYLCQLQTMLFLWLKFNVFLPFKL